MKEEKSELFSTKEIQAIRPEPIVADIDVVSFKRAMPTQMVKDAVLEGYTVLISDYYSSGLLLLNALKTHLKQEEIGHNLKAESTKEKKQSFQQQRDFRSIFRDYSHHIVLLIHQRKIKVKKAPEIGWLKILYLEIETFLLPYPQIQGLNSAWQWYQK